MTGPASFVDALTERWSPVSMAPSGHVGRPPREDVDVLLAGTSLDAHLPVVAHEVHSRGRSASIIHADVDFAGGLNLALRPPASITAQAVLCRSMDIQLPIPHHGWSAFVAVDPFDPEDPFHGHSHREAASAAQCWLDLLDTDCWVNEPWAARRADSKALQLRSAARLGLSTPRTVITADVDCLLEFAESCEGGLVHKPMGHPLTYSEGGEAGFLHAVPMSVQELQALGSGLPYAALFQERLNARAEYRVTVVGDAIFAGRLDRPPGSTVDWRRGLANGPLPFVPVELDAGLQHSVVSLVRQLGLVFATVDLLEQENSQVYLLEVNPSGSYLWLPHDLAALITGALADLLLENGR